MKSFINLLGAIFFLLVSFSSVYGQDGAFDVRFTMKDTNCVDSYYYVLIEIKAVDATKTFNLSDQNYRFSFNKDAVKPYDLNLGVGDRSVQIDTMHLTSFIQDSQGAFSFYDPHTLTGSIDSIVSYNVVLSGGVGYYINETDWVKVGCLRFEYLNPAVCPRFKWHDSAPENFPPTFIGEKYNDTLTIADEGVYLNYNEDCSLLPCFRPLPIELVEFVGEEDEDCKINLSWTTASETNNDRFLVKQSYDGLSYRTIAEIQGYGDGTSTTSLSYSFEDTNVSKDNYYRLDQVDIDGTTSSSEVLLIKSRCFTGVVGISELYPNPIIKGNQIIKLKLDSGIDSPDAELIITDVLGKELARENVVLVAGPNQIEYNTQRLASGAYFVQVVGTDWYSIPRKFVKLD